MDSIKFGHTCTCKVSSILISTSWQEALCISNFPAFVTFVMIMGKLCDYSDLTTGILSLLCSSLMNVLEWQLAAHLLYSMMSWQKTWVYSFSGRIAFIFWSKNIYLTFVSFLWLVSKWCCDNKVRNDMSNEQECEPF
jgi:hypothetical protein